MYKKETLADTEPASFPVNFGIVAIKVANLTAGTVTIKDGDDDVLETITFNDGSKAQTIGFQHLGGSITLTASADASTPRVVVAQE